MKYKMSFFIGLMLIALPGIAGATAIEAANSYVSPTRADPQSGAISAASGPKYNFVGIDDSERQNIASTAYVKGAHNSALSAINYLEGSKQAVLNSGNGGNVSVTYTSNNSDAPVVTGISADGSGAVVITKSEVTIPVSSVSAPTAHANIWIE